MYSDIFKRHNCWKLLRNLLVIASLVLVFLYWTSFIQYSPNFWNNASIVIPQNSEDAKYFCTVPSITTVQPLEATAQNATSANATSVTFKLTREQVLDESSFIHETSETPLTEVLPAQLFHDGQKNATLQSNNKNYTIHWYNAPEDLRNQPVAMHCGFADCEFNNCHMTFDRKLANYSDAVLFDGRFVHKQVAFHRPRNQVWIFAAHETPVSYEDPGNEWKNPQWRSSFNWTMTYDKTNADIFLPYGEIRKYTKQVTRNFIEIARQKQNTNSSKAVWISSHCDTRSKREDFIKKNLTKYIDVDMLGGCGKQWNCGRAYVHDDCFQLVNKSYMFYLAFENALCKQYFTEKFYENFDFDTIMIIRGGDKGEAKSLFPKGTFISTDEFKSIEDLGRYLQKLIGSPDEYAKILERKSQYYSAGYKAVYQRSMCDICERMNHQEKYHKEIPDIVHWAYGPKACRSPDDM